MFGRIVQKMRWESTGPVLGGCGTLCQHDISLLWQWGCCVHKHMTEFFLWGHITEAGAVLTSPAVSQGWNKDLTPAAVQRKHQLSLERAQKCLSPRLSSAAFLSFKATSLTSSLHSLFYFTCKTLFAPFFFSTSLPIPPSCFRSSSSYLQILSSDTTLISCQLFFPLWTSVSVAQ